MRVAVTDRTGLDDSPLEVYLERTEWEQAPAAGETACVYGPDGWRYIGPIVEINAEAHSYTIKPVASNKRQDNLKAWHGAALSRVKVADRGDS